MDDFDDLVQQIRAGAEKRNLRLLEAEFPKKPDVIFRYGTTSVDEVLDVAQQSFAPFVSLTVSRLDRAELIESWGEKDFFSEAPPEPPTELLGLWEERAGQIDGVFVEWVGGGATFIFLAVPAWKQELEGLRDGWSEDRDAQRADEYRAVLIRITHLAEQVEMLTNTHRWSHTPGNAVVPSRWQATEPIATRGAASDCAMSQKGRCSPGDRLPVCRFPGLYLSPPRSRMRGRWHRHHSARCESVSAGFWSLGSARH